MSKKERSRSPSPEPQTLEEGMVFLLINTPSLIDAPTYFLSRLDKVQEELLYYPRHRCWRWRQNVKVFTLKFFM